MNTKPGTKRLKFAGRLTVALVLLLASKTFAADYYVSLNGTNANDGSSWEKAKRDIYSALNSASSGDSIQVAQGTYEENLSLRDNISLFGGYTGNGCERVINTSTIKAKVSGPVIKASNVGGAVLDGFTITDGNAPSGGGIFIQGGSLVVSRNIIKNNQATVGGGVYLAGFRGQFIKNTVQDNSVTAAGAGMYCSGLPAEVLIANNTIINNSGVSGGGMFITASSGAYRYNTIRGNSASQAGGGVYFADFSGTFSNNYIANNSARVGGATYLSDLNNTALLDFCTIENNTSGGAGGGLFITDFEGQIRNSIIGNNGDMGIYYQGNLTGTITYSDIEGGHNGTGNSNVLPSGQPASNGTPRGNGGGTPPVNNAPFASATSSITSETQCTGAYVNLNGSSSYDPEVGPLEYTWTWNGGTACGKMPKQFFTFGDHTVELSITDINIYSNINGITTIATTTVTVPYPTSCNIEITSPSSGAVISGSGATANVTVTGNINDKCATVKVNGVTATIYTNKTFAANITLDEGENTIIGSATLPGGATCSDSLTIKRPPTCSDITGQTIEEGGTFTEIDLNEHVYDPDNTDDEINWTVSNNSPLIVSIDNDNKAHISALNDNWCSSNTITMTFKATDPDGLSCSKDATFGVTCVYDSPICTTIPSQSIAEGAQFSTINLDNYIDCVDIGYNDSQITWETAGNSDLTVSITNRVATITAPNAEWHGAEEITFIGHYQGYSCSKAAMFTVNSIEDAPICGTVNSQTITEGGQFASFDLSASDLDGTAVTWTATGPENSALVITISNNKTVTITTPYADWCGSETITFTAKDPGGLSCSTGATFNVTCVNDTPVCSTLADQLLECGKSVTINLATSVTEIDNDTLTWSYSGNDKLTVSLNDAVATVTAPANWYGNETITFKAKDSGSLYCSIPVKFIVTCNQAPGCSTIPAQTVEQCGTFSPISLDSYVGDDNSDSDITWTASGGTKLTVSIADRVATITASDSTWYGSESITFTATDKGGLSCTQAVTFTVSKETTVPTITCSNLTLECSGTSGATQPTDFIKNQTTATDNCSSTVTVTSDAPATFPAGDTTVKFTATDGAGNISYCSSVVKVQDTTKPTISCPGDVVISETVEFNSTNFKATATDTCDSTPTITSDLPSTLPQQPGVTTVTFTAKDDFSNSATCTATITREAGNDPTIYCPGDLIIDAQTADGTSSSALPATFKATAQDKKGAVIPTTNNIPANLPIGNTVVTFSATSKNKTSSCQATITVLPYNPPSSALGTSVASEQTPSIFSAQGGTTSTTSTTNKATAVVVITSPADGTVVTSSDITVTYTVNGIVKTTTKKLQEGMNVLTIQETDAAGNTGSATITIVLSTPSSGITIITPSDGATVGSTPVTVIYALNGVSKSVSKALSEGPNTITITDTDSSGHTVSASVSITLNSAPPLVVITYPENGATVTNSQITVAYKLNGVGKTAPKTLTEGPNVITIEEMDNLGRTGSDTVTVTLKANAPKVTITSPENGATVASSPVTISYTVDDVLKTALYDLKKGENTVTVQGSDNLGRTGSDSIKVTLDPNAPVITITSPENGATVASSPVTVNYTVDGESRSISKPLTKGVNTITIQETNASGHQGSASITVTLKDAAPVVKITSPKNASTVTASPVTVTYLVDNVVKTVSKPLVEGKNTITISETDSLNRTGTDSVTVTLNSSAPKIVITSPLNNAVVNITPITVTYVVGEKSKAASWDLIEGKNTITIEETDALGRKGTASITVTLLRKDNNPLLCPADVTVEQKTLKGTVVTLQATASDPQKPVTNITSNIPAIFPRGTTTVTFSGKTTQGETVSCNCKVTVEDTTPPIVNLLVNPKKDEYFTTDSLSIVYLVTDQADEQPKIKLELTNGTQAPKDITASSPATLNLGNYAGDNTLTLTATDAAGNKQIATFKFKVTLKLNTLNMDITPKILNSKTETITLNLTFPEPYDLGSISNVTADGAPSEGTIAFVKQNVAVKETGSSAFTKVSKTVKATLTFQLNKLTVKPLDTTFEIKGAFIINGEKYPFIGNTSVNQVTK